LPARITGAGRLTERHPPVHGARPASDASACLNARLVAVSATAWIAGVAAQSEMRAGLWAGKRAHARLSETLTGRMKTRLTLPDLALLDSRNEGVPGSSPGVGFSLGLGFRSGGVYFDCEYSKSPVYPPRTG
jgi:hypothetical protein